MSNQKIIAIIGVIVLAVVLVTVLFLLPAQDKEGPELAEGEEPAVEAPPKPETLDEVVKILNTSELLIAFLNEYFTIEERQGLVAYEPEEFYNKQRGASHDFAVFAAYLLWQNGMEAGVVRIDYIKNGKEGTHTVALFREENKPKYLTFTDTGCRIYHHGLGFEELIKSEEKRLNIKASKYTYFPADFQLNDLREPAPYRDWIQVE